MSSQPKRIRSTNYSLEEKNLLMTLVNELKHIIENKKTDAVTNSEKEKAWNKIANEFNAISPSGTFRDGQSLKKTYLNIKMAVRKEVADEKIETFKTGGGIPSKSTSNPLRDITLQTMNEKTVFGLNNEFDSDANKINNDASISENDCETIYLEVEDHIENENSWSKWKANDLKKPTSSPLIPKFANGENLTPHSSRRRPAATMTLQSSNIAKIYNELAEKRLEVAEVELEILKNKERREEEKHKLEKNILEVQLKIKLDELNKLNPDWVSAFINKNK
ncbi:hypothetical protein NQ318_008431 [Aromia moschata]|uniref:Regulatory protein zeste n=1 Tax=Aromia moschata TaxID=1265417 RepID=A0AAV8YB78_9CUCU|nr:hypothetical protein NQ318_008431 [Aromia moschata]